MSDTTAPENGGEKQEFTPPASQDELNRIVGERVARERAKYADYDDLKQKATRLAEIEEAQKSEEQKRAEREAALEAELNTYKTREQIASWAKEITKDSPVPADLLRGSTREELEAHFEQLKPLILAPSDPAPQRVAVAGEGGGQPIPLNGDGIEAALRKALGG